MDSRHSGIEEFVMAAREGNLDVLKQYCEHRKDDFVYLMGHAARMGHLNVVKWIHKNRKLYSAPDRFNDFYKLYNFKGFGWDYVDLDFDEHGKNISVSSYYSTTKKDIMNAAAQGGHLEIVKWLHNAGYSCCTAAMDTAAENGHLEVVKWLHKNRKEGCSKFALDQAIVNGHLDVVKFLIKNRREGSSFVKNPRKERWLRFRGIYMHWMCPMDAAAYNGQFDVIEWLVKNTKIKNTFWTVFYAAQKGQLDVLKLMYDKERDGFVDNVLDDVVDPDTLNWLLDTVELKCTGRCVNNLVNNNEIELAKYLLNYHNFRSRQDGLLAASAVGSEKHFKRFLKLKIGNVNYRDCMVTAAKNGNMDYVIFIHKNRRENHSPILPGVFALDDLKHIANYKGIKGVERILPIIDDLEGKIKRMREED